MKTPFSRILILLLACCMVLCGCSNGTPIDTTSATTEPAATTGIKYSLDDDGPFISNLSVGYARVDISPTEPTPLRGYGYSSGRMSSNIQDPLYATCIALTDSGENTVLLFTLDLTNAYTTAIDDARQQVSDVTGVPFDAIMVSATHNHSSPDLENTADPSIPKYIESLKSWMAQAAVFALADRAPTRVYITSAQTENLNFVRRYQLQDGTYAGDNFGNFENAPISCHETQADGELQLVCFHRQKAKDVILANFQMHPYREGSSTNTNVTADIIAPFREKMETTLDCHFAYFTGASGNVNPTSRIEAENITGNYIEQGQALADYALSAYFTFQEIPTTSVKITKTIHKAKVDHSLSYWGRTAIEAVKHYEETGELGIYEQQLRYSGIKSVDQLSAVAIRSTMPYEYEIPIYAVTLGDLAFVTVPFEMFDTNGMQIKDSSPFSMTFVLTCTNNDLGYLPSDLAFHRGGYTVDVTLFVRGTAEDLVGSCLSMLDSLYFSK